MTALAAAVQLYQMDSHPTVTVDTMLQIYPNAGEQLRSYTVLELNAISRRCGVMRLCQKLENVGRTTSCLPILVAENLVWNGCRNLAPMGNMTFVISIYLGSEDINCRLWDQPNCKGQSTAAQRTMREFNYPTIIKSMECRGAPTCCLRNNKYDMASMHRYDPSSNDQVTVFSLPRYKGKCTAYVLEGAGNRAQFCAPGSVQVSGAIECSEWTITTPEAQYITTARGSGSGLDGAPGKTMDVRCINNISKDQSVFLQDPHAAASLCNRKRSKG